MNGAHEVASMRHVNSICISNPDYNIFNAWETDVSIVYMNTIHYLKRRHLINELTETGYAAAEMDLEQEDRDGIDTCNLP